MIEVEIKGHYGQFIKGYLRKICEDKGVISYADDPTSEDTIPLSELRFPPAADTDNFVVNHHTRVEALLPISGTEDPVDNNFIEALSNLKISQPALQTISSSRLANPFACLTCPSWWPCVVTKVREAHAVVQLRPVLPVTDSSSPQPPKEYTELATSLAAMTEICERKMLRPATAPDAPSLNPNSLFTHKIAVPSELHSFASDPAVHESMLRHCGGPANVVFENEHLVFLSPSQEVIRVVSLLEEMHLRMLRQKHGLMRYITNTKKMQDGQDTLRNGSLAETGTDGNSWPFGDNEHIIERFTVSSFLMGLAIGTQGANIRAARSIPGVKNIEVREMLLSPQQQQLNGIKNDDQPGPAHTDTPVAQFVVLAETREAAKSARALLEYCEMCLLVPKRLIGRIMGNRSANIFGISSKSGVKHIYIQGDPSKLPTHVEANTTADGRLSSCLRVEDIHPELGAPDEKDAESGCIIVGTREAVEKARLLISFQIDCIFDLEKLEIQKISLLRELPSLRGGGPHGHGPQHEAGQHQLSEDGGSHYRGGNHGAPHGRGPTAGQEDSGHQRSSNQVGGGRGGGRRGGARFPPRSSGDMVAEGQSGSNTSPPPQEHSSEVPEQKAEDSSSMRRKGAARANRQRVRNGAMPMSQELNGDPGNWSNGREHQNAQKEVDVVDTNGITGQRNVRPRNLANSSTATAKKCQA